MKKVMKKVLFDVENGDANLYFLTDFGYGKDVQYKELICMIKDVTDVDLWKYGRNFLRISFACEDVKNDFTSSFMLNDYDEIEFVAERDMLLTVKELLYFIDDHEDYLKHTYFDIQGLYEMLVEWKKETDPEWTKDI